MANKEESSPKEDAAQSSANLSPSSEASPEHVKASRSGPHSSDDIPGYVSIYGGSEFEPTLKSIDGITVTPALAGLITRLPADLSEYPINEIAEMLAYKEFNQLCGGIGIRVQKSRTKNDIIHAINKYTGQFWQQLQQKAASVQMEAAKSAAVAAIAPVISLPTIQTVRPVRTPYDKRFADILSEMHGSSPSAWNNILIATDPNESKRLIEAFSAIYPETAKSAAQSMDVLSLSYISGPIRVATESVAELRSDMNVLQKMIDIINSKSSAARPDEPKPIT